MRFWVAALCLPVLALPGWGQDKRDEELTVDEALTVKRQLVDVRVLDRKGRPVLGLDASNFALTQRGREIPILSCNWVDSSNHAVNPYPGRLVVFYFQVLLDGPRVAGIERKVRQALAIAGTLEKHDRIAVVSFDSHLKLWSDFTGSPTVLRESLRHALRRDRAPYPQAGSFPSLAAHLDQEAGREADTPELGLVELGRALERFEGSKTLVYLSFDSSDYSRGNFQLRHDYPAALAALNKSRTTVIGFDFAPYEYNTQEMAIRQFAEDTGGYFVKTINFVKQAVSRFEDAISGYYTLSHHIEDPIDPYGKFKLVLKGARGRIMAKSPYNSWGDHMTRPKKLRGK